nr:hypothetical protein [Tanacetum cinerariifolium]
MVGKGCDNSENAKRFCSFLDLDIYGSVRRPKLNGVVWKKKGSSNTSSADLPSFINSNLNKNVKRCSHKDLLSCNNSHHEDTRSAYDCNDDMNVSCNSRLHVSYDVNDLFVFDDIFYICLWILDSGYSKHMTGNHALLTNFVEKFLGTVRFGNDDFAVIAGYGDVVIGSMTIKNVYCVEGLRHNLFSVGKFCDNDLCGLIRVKSINRKRYVLVVVDDYSRYASVFFFRLKDEALEVIISFIKQTHVNLQFQVQRVRTDNGTEFKNKTLAKFFDEVGITQQFSAARTPQENGVMERRNLTLITKSPTMNVEISNDEIPSHKEEVFHESSESFQKEYFSSSLNADVQQSSKEVTVPSSNTQLVSNEIVPNVDEASTSHNVFNERFIEPANVAEALKDVDWNAIDYDEMFAHVARIKAIRLFLAYDAHKDFMVFQMDVKTAFLNRILKEEVCVGQPPGFVRKQYPNHVYALDKALYGLKQAPRAWIFINQSKYIHDILKRFEMENCDTVPTPMVEQAKLKFDLVGKPVDHTDFRSMIGSLMYLTSSRPDIMFAILEAEYVVLCSCCAHVLWMRTQLTNYGFFYDKIPIYYDSKSAIAVSCNLGQYTRTKHIDVRYHFIKDHVEKGTIELYFVGTGYQLADLFTKSLPEA